MSDLAPTTLPATLAAREVPAQAAPATVLYLDHTAALSGGEIALFRLLEALDRELVRPVVLLGAEGPLVERLRTLGVETVVMPLGENVREVRKDTLGFGAWRRLGAVLSTVVYGLRVAWFARRRGAKIIHANSLKSDIYGGIAGFLARVPVIWHVRDHINKSYLPGPAVAMFRFLAGRVPAFVVTNSQSTLGELHLDRERPTAIVPSGLRLRSGVVHDGLAPNDDTDTLEENSPGERPWSSPVRIGLVGRIARWKGQHVFIEAAQRVLAAGGDAEFWIIGGPLFGEEAYEEELLAQAEKAGLGARVKFLGFQPRVQEIYRQLDIVAHASISPEPFGQVVIEGMAEGLPVVATDGGGVREIINHGKNGLLVPMGDAPAMALALESLLRDPAAAQALGSAGYRWVRRHFTAAQSARKIEAGVSHYPCSRRELNSPPMTMPIAQPKPTSSLHNRPVLVRSAAAMLHQTVGSLGRPASVVNFVKAICKLPVEYRAAQAHQSIPMASFGELFPEFRGEMVSIPGESLNRHDWNVKLHEEIYLQAAVRALQPKKIFEIGTFNGQTTLQLAKASPEETVVYTLDLPEEMFDATQSPEAFNGQRVGEVYRQSPLAGKVQQIRADATTFDFSPYAGQIDFIFVDAAHDYPHGLLDSRSALKMAKPGGAIVWHDFEPFWSGLVHAVCEANEGRPLRRLAGTSMAVLRV